MSKDNNKAWEMGKLNDTLYDDNHNVNDASIKLEDSDSEVKDNKTVGSLEVGDEFWLDGTEVSDSYKVLGIEHSGNGLDAYYLEDSNGETILSIRGTEAGLNIIKKDPINDISADAMIASGKNPQSEKLKDIIEDNSELKNVDTIVGHSLGGGVALDVSLWLNKEYGETPNVYVYDPAPFTEFDEDSIIAMQEYINVYTFDDEMLSGYMDETAKHISKVFNIFKHAFNPADYFDIHHINEDNKGHELGFGDHALEPLVVALGNSNATMLVDVEYGAEPYEDVEIMKLNEEVAKKELIDNFSEDTQHIIEVKNRLIGKFDLAKEKAAGRTIDKVEAAHETLIDSLDRIVDNDMYLSIKEENDKIYAYVKEWSEKNYSDIVYFEDYSFRTIDQQMESSYYDFETMKQLKDNIASIYKGSISILKGVKDIGISVSEITQETSVISNNLGEIQDSLEELVGIKVSNDFSENKSIDIPEEKEKREVKAWSGEVKSEEEVFDDYKKELNNLIEHIKNLNDKFVKLEDYMAFPSGNSGHFYNKEYLDLKEVSKVVYDEGIKIFGNVNELINTLTTFEESTANEDKSLSEEIGVK